MGLQAVLAATGNACTGGHGVQRQEQLNQLGHDMVGSNGAAVRVRVREPVRIAAHAGEERPFLGRWQRAQVRQQRPPRLVGVSVAPIGVTRIDATEADAGAVEVGTRPAAWLQGELDGRQNACDWEIEIA